MIIAAPPCGMFMCEGGTASTILNAGPGLHAVSDMHDWINAVTERQFNLGATPEWFNYATMPAAAAVTYAGLINTSIGVGMVAGSVYSHNNP